MRDDLIGLALVVIGIVLFVAVVVPSDGIASHAIGDALRLAFGLGAYIVPFAFIIWGITYFVKTEDTKTSRIIIGLVLIVLAIMSFLSLFNGGANAARPMSYFDRDVLVSGGGYVGSGIDWLFVTLFGEVITCIILLALIVVGLVLFGLSISVPFLFLKNLFGKQSEDEQSSDFDVYDDVPLDKTRSLDDDFEQEPLFDEASEDEPAKGFTKVFKRKKGTGADVTQDLSADKTVALDKKGGSDKTVDLSVAKRPSAAKTVKTPRKRQGATVTRPARKSSSSSASGAQPTAMEGFVLPDPKILRVGGSHKSANSSELRQTASLLQQTLGEFNVPARVVGWLAGPTVTMFKVELPSGVRLSRLTGLSDDIALALAASAVRIAQIPNTSLVGVEIPNKKRESVLLGDVLPAAKPGPLQLAVGEDVDGDKICVDLAKMPHLLIGGTTGSGKSITLNAMIMSILMRATPAEVRMILIDPKRVEFSLYNGIPHLFVPPVTEAKEAASALKWCVAEMERRLKVFEGVGARNIGFYNQLIQKGELDDEDGKRPAELPYIVVVIDELSDLMMIAGKEVEDSIVRISQLARAAGIHLIVATQRPSSNVVTGMIKANITNRIAMTVATNVESRVILDQSGAEKLVGNGDMLFSKPEWGKPKRIQGCYVDEAEISSVVAHLKEQAQPDYHPEILQQAVSEGKAGGGAGGSSSSGDEDPLLWEAADAVVSAGLGSTSMLQRRLKVGYARAGRIMDMLEEKGIVGPQNGSRARDVLVDSVEELESLRAFEEQDQEAG
ncbi:MAG: DNA translocase FtsK 4TM domain-containing protein [Coriobacteriales bacterium]